MGPHFSCLRWKHVLAIRSKGAEPSVQTKGRARQNNAQLSQEGFWGQHKLLLRNLESLASTPPRLDTKVDIHWQRRLQHCAKHSICWWCFPWCSKLATKAHVSSLWEKQSALTLVWRRHKKLRPHLHQASEVASHFSCWSSVRGMDFKYLLPGTLVVLQWLEI